MPTTPTRLKSPSGLKRPAVEKAASEIQDNGSGMSEQDIREKWCRLASENKIAAPYTDRFRRRRLGAKGIGRFSAAKLGNRLKLTTRQVGSPQQVTLSLPLASTFRNARTIAT